MANYLTPLRRIAEAVSARLCYDYLCFKGPLFDEAYLSHSVSDIICTFYDGSMPFCVELDNLKDTDAPIHQPAAMLVAAD
jgi:hypothetical protein